jgi:opacity protein-like surface antigen
MRTPFVCLAMLLAGPAAAQDAQWSFAASLYAWVPGMDASVGTDLGTVDSSLTGSDALANLDMALMGTFEARRGKLGLLGDLIYADLSSSQDTPFGLLFRRAEVDTKLTAVSGYATYRVYDTDTMSIDLGGGFRAFGLDLDTSLEAGLLPEQNFDTSESWVDPLVMARFIVPINERWFTTAFADVGGLDSSSTWQAFASVGYRFDERWSTQLGYRYMQIEKEISGQDASIELYGPLLGFTVRF